MKNLIFKISISLLCVCFITGCSFVDELNRPQTIISTDELISVDVPGMWTKQDLHDDSTLSMAYALSEQYLIVIPESVEDFDEDTTLEDYTKIIKDNMEQSVDKVVITDTKDVTIGESLKSKEFYVSGSVDKIKVKYIVVTTTDGKHFYQIVMWSLTSKFEEAEPVYRDILKSFKVK